MKRFFKTILAVLTVCAVLLSLGCAAKAKTFSKNGFTITLTDDFEETNYGGYTAAFASEEMFLVALKEDFSYFEGEYGANSSLEDYAKLLISSNDIDATLEKDADLLYYTYDIYDIGTQEISHTFLAAVYKTEDAFWLVQFAVDAKDFDAQKETVITYAKSVSFD